MVDNSTVLLVLLEQKFTFFNTLSNITMLWWVSSIVYCGSIIGGVWRFQNQVAQLTTPVRRGLFVVVLAFFVSIICYGIICVVFVIRIKNSTSNILKELRVDAADLLEFDVYVVLVSIGTTSFVLAAILWALLWSNIGQGNVHEPDD